MNFQPIKDLCAAYGIEYNSVISLHLEAGQDVETVEVALTDDGYRIKGDDGEPLTVTRTYPLELAIL